MNIDIHEEYVQIEFDKPDWYYNLELTKNEFITMYEHLNDESIVTFKKDDFILVIQPMKRQGVIKFFITEQFDSSLYTFDRTTLIEEINKLL